MDKRRYLQQQQDQSRPDRSRSPHQRKQPWDSNGEPKSVLYSVEVQFHRSPNKYTQCHRSPSKPSSSKSHLKCSSSMPTKAPLKELPQANRCQTSAHPHARDGDASVQRLVEKLQRWTNRYSPPKFMAGMMSAEGVYELPEQTTPKRRSHGPWFVEYFSKTDDIPQKQKSREESRSSRENIIRIEKENRRTDECLASRNKTDCTPSLQQKFYSKPPLSAELGSSAVEIDEGGHRIPSGKKCYGSVTPSGRKFEATCFRTPAGVASPNEEFFTPMTHLRPKEEKKDIVKASNPLTSPAFTTDPERSRFALINENGPSSSRILMRDTTIKERIEGHLAAYDRVSSKLDISLREANELLNRPLKLGLPSLTDNSTLLALGSDRQTIDPSNLEKLRKENSADDRSPRRSMPLNAPESASNRLSHRFAVTQGENANADGAFTVSSSREMPSNSQLPKSDISLPKALGAGMAAELAYAEKAQRVRTHLNATRRLASGLGGRLGHHSIQKQDNDDIDRILDSISLRDESLLTYSQNRDESVAQESLKPLHVTPHANPKVTTTIGPRRALVLSAEEREERKKKVEEYIRMCGVLRSLQHAVYKLKRRFTSAPEQLAKIDELSKAADVDFSEAIVDAKSWLSSRITYSEFSLLVMRRKKKAYMDSEDCTNTIKQLLTAQVARTNNTDETSFLNPPAANVNELSPVRVDTRALNESVGCDMWNLSARSLRRNLDARREQAEMLNRSFEERTKDIEQRTKESIAVQIVKYDHVIAERTSLLSILDEISLEQNPGLSILSVEGKDSAIVPSLEKISQSLQEEQSQSHVDQDHADVGISRAYSQSTVYEDSLSRFDEEEGSRSGSAGSEATLYRSDLEDEATEISKSQQHTQPSRRTLDTAEALTMLSRQIVTVIGDNTTRVEVDQILERIVEENVEVKVAVAKKDAAVNEGNIGEKLHKAEVSEDMNTITDREPLSTDVQEIGNDGKFKADVVENRDEAGDAARSSYESTKIEVSMTKPSEVEDGTQKCLPDKNAPPCDEIFLDISLGRDEVDEQGRKLQDKYVQMSDSKECNDFESTQRENFEAMSLLSSVQKPKEKLTAQRDDTIFEETFDAEKESEGEWLSEDEDSSAVLESKNRPEGTEAENVADIGKHEEINAWKSEEVTTGYDADGRDETSGKVASSSPQLSTTAEELIPTSKTNALELASATTSSRVLTDDQIGNEAATAILAVTPADDKILAGENQETDSYELSFLDRIPDRTVDGRASLGLNRSELCDSLSTSIMHLMTDSPRRRSLPRSYNLSDSLLDDSVPVLVTKSPRAAKERFNTKMPGPFSPRMQLLLENSLDTSIPNVLADEVVKNVLSSDILNELDKDVERLSARVEQRIAASAASPPLNIVGNNAPPASSQNLFEQLDETYEDLLSIEKPPSQLRHVVSSVESTADTLPSHVADTPRKPPTSQISQPSAEEIKRKRMDWLSEQLHSREWMGRKCTQLVDHIWSKIRTQGFTRPLLDEFLPAPEVADDIVAGNEDERLLVENRTTMVWAAIVEAAAKLWPESYEGSRHLGSKLIPTPKTKEEFAVKAEQYVLEQLSEMPPSHRHNRLSHPPPPPYVDTAVDRAVARRFYEEDPYSFAKKVNTEYRKLCEELIDRMGDRFLPAEVQRMHQRFVASGDDATLLTPFTSSSRRLSGEFGRPSLARLSMGSDVSIGQCSYATSSPLRVTHDGQQE